MKKQNLSQKNKSKLRKNKLTNLKIYLKMKNEMNLRLV